MGWAKGERLNSGAGSVEAPSNSLPLTTTDFCYPWSENLHQSPCPEGCVFGLHLAFSCLRSHPPDSHFSSSFSLALCLPTTAVRRKKKSKRVCVCVYGRTGRTVRRGNIPRMHFELFFFFLLNFFIPIFILFLPCFIFIFCHALLPAGLVRPLSSVSI